MDISKNRELFKKILMVVFAVALVSVVVGFVGIIFLNQQFETTYYKYGFNGSLLLDSNQQDLLRSGFTVLISLTALGLLFITIAAILATINFKSEKTKKIANIINLVLMSVIILFLIIMIVKVCSIHSSFASYAENIFTDDGYFGYYYVGSVDGMTLQSLYEAVISQSLSLIIPMIIVGTIGFAFFLCSLIKRKANVSKENQENEAQIPAEAK